MSAGRKVRQLIIDDDPKDGLRYLAVCDDGTLWETCELSAQEWATDWTLLPAPPAEGES